MIEELKYCKFCNKQKPIKDFCKSGGFIKNICRECHNKKQKERYANNKLVYEKDKEIERLNKELEEYKKDFKEANDLALKLITNNQEYVRKSIKDTIDILIEKLQQKENIIKEVRETLENNDDEYQGAVYDALKILDKEDK